MITMMVKVIQGSTMMAQNDWVIGKDVPADELGEYVASTMQTAMKHRGAKVERLRIEITFEKRD